MVWNSKRTCKDLVVNNILKINISKDSKKIYRGIGKISEISKNGKVIQMSIIDTIFNKVPWKCSTDKIIIEYTKDRRTKVEFNDLEYIISEFKINEMFGICKKSLEKLTTCKTCIITLWKPIGKYGGKHHKYGGGCSKCKVKK